MICRCMWKRGPVYSDVWLLEKKPVYMMTKCKASIHVSNFYTTEGNAVIHSMLSHMEDILQKRKSPMGVHVPDNKWRK